MAVQTSYPGVYVQEVPSGVRTITGVSTSITAFVGVAKRGPINRAITITSNADYERRFGGLFADSEMSFAVKQFFMNGGTQAVIVRLAANAVAASRILDSRAGDNVLLVTAADAGREGNRIEIRVNYQTLNPDSLFNLVLIYTPSDSAAPPVSEIHTNLSMNSSHTRFVENIVNASSDLVRVTSNALPLIAGLGAGTAISGQLADVGTLLDDTHNSFRIIINESDAVTVTINVPAVVAAVGAAARLTELCNQIATSVTTQANGQPALATFTCVPDGNSILMTSGVAGENSMIKILPGPGNDAAGRLQLGLMFGGREIDGVANNAAGIRDITPAEAPDRGTLESADLVDNDITVGPPVITSAAAHRFRISLDGGLPVLVDLDLPVIPLTGVADLAALIHTAVRALRPTTPAFRDFTCEAVPGSIPGTNFHLRFSSGSRGSNSSVTISQELPDVFATSMHLLVDGSATTATVTNPQNIMLQAGVELPVTPLNAYQVYTGNQALRTGLYALEPVDIFNILCLPGVTDPGILSESISYCELRRAFMIIDAPPNSIRPEQMVATISGTALPKSDHAAVYYPWVHIANPLNGGQLRLSAPCGTMAGLYARTDASRGVWKAPAGTEARLNGAQRVEYLLTDAENGILNPLAVNCIRSFTDSGIVAWGGRTLGGSDANASEWKYIPVRRTALYIEESLYRGLKWVVFEPNDEPLWAQIRLNVGAFMHNLFRQGAFQGTKKNDAYFVKCDSETTTQNDINLGRVNIWVGFAPLKPAEFVILYLQQMAGNILV